MAAIAYIQLLPEKVFESLEFIHDLLRHEIKGYSPDNLKEVISIIACHTRKERKPIPLKINYIKTLVSTKN